MKRATKLTLAVALPVAALALTGNSAFAAPPPVDPPSPELGATPPTTFVSLTDDTGTITVDVPNSWTDVDTAPAGEDPWISAAPDFLGFVSTFGVPGVIFQAVSYTADTATVARDNGYADSCAYEEVQPYDDGVFAGSHLIDTGCGESGTTEYHVIAANPDNQAFTAVLDIQITQLDDASIVDGILDSFNLTDDAWAGSSGPNASTPAAAAPGGAFPAPSGEIPADWATIVDHTQTITIAVPPAWTDVDVMPGFNSDGTDKPWISASTDLDTTYTVFERFGVPGVDFQALTFEADTAARLARSALNDVCTAEPVQTYDDGVFVGHIEFFDACDGTTSRIAAVVANPADGAFTASVQIQLTGQPDDEATLNGLLLSFNKVKVANPGPPASVVDAPTTTLSAGDALGGLQPLVDQLGLTLTDEQAGCIANGVAQLDPSDITAAVDDPFGMPPLVLVTLLDCGVDVFDIPSG
jgi:hypothetical protein